MHRIPSKILSMTQRNILKWYNNDSYYFTTVGLYSVFLEKKGWVFKSYKLYTMVGNINYILSRNKPFLKELEFAINQQLEQKEDTQWKNFEYTVVNIYDRTLNPPKGGSGIPS